MIRITYSNGIQPKNISKIIIYIMYSMQKVMIVKQELKLKVISPWKLLWISICPRMKS